MTLTEIIVGLLSAALSALGFAVMFRVRKKHLLATAIGGLLAYGLYLLLRELGSGEFFANLFAAILTAVFSEICAHLLRAPVQLYMIPVLVPLVPGGALYYAMYHLLAKDYALFTQYLLTTLEIALGVSGGIIIGLAAVSAVIALLNKVRKPKGNAGMRCTEQKDS